MNSITIKPKDGERYEIGYQGDHNVNKLVFDVESEGDLYLKLQQNEKEYEPIPIPNKEFPITSTYTQEQCTYFAQILEKDELGDFKKNSPIFKLSLKKSIEETDQIMEVVPPNFQTAYDNMVDITNQIKKAFENGDFNGNGIVSVEKESTSGLTDTYKIVFSDGKETKFNVTNGKGIVSTEKTNTQENIDTYTIMFNDETTSTFTVTNGKSAYEIAVENGFEGTEEEWLESLQYDHSDEFKQLVEQVKQDINSAVENAMNEANTTAQENVEAINQASTNAQNDITTTKDNAVQAVQSAQQTAENAIGTKQTEAVQAVDTAKTSATQEITEQKESVVSAITQERSEAIEAIETGRIEALNDIATDKTGALESIETAKDEAIEEIENTGVPLEDIEKLAVKETIQGNPTIISDSADWKLQSLNVYGQSAQDGTPTPETPVEIISKEVSEIKVTGKNLFDSSLCESRSGLTVVHNEDGSITVTGTPINAYASIYKSALKLKKGTYTIKGGSQSTTNLYLQLKDTEKEKYYIDTTFTLTDDAELECSVLCGAYLSELNVTIYPIICFGTDGTFEPYKSQTMTLSEPITLRGIPVSSDGNVTIDGQQYVADEIDFNRGVYVQRTGKIVISDITKLNIDAGTTGSRFSANTPNRISKPRTPALCNYFPYNDVITGSFSTEGTYIATDEIKIVFFRLDEDITIEEFRQRFPDLTAYYILEIPIEIPLAAEDVSAYRILKSYYPNTVIDTGAWTKVEYVADTKMYIDKQVTALSEAMLER